jgi:adenylate cyclase
MSEVMDTQDMVNLVNLYYEIMTTVIGAHNGFLDKFVGDAIMSVWGAPTLQPGHAGMACLAALEQQRQMDKVNREREAQGKPILNCLMGINTGQVIAGNIGAKNHMAYTMMGDSVNLASRLVSVNKLFKSKIIASEATVNLAEDQIVFRPLDKVRVVGRKRSINIYEVLCCKSELTPEQSLMINFFERALRHYWNRDFTGALARFERALQAVPTDKASEFFLTRCRDYIANPPAEDWDGVTVLGLK